MSDFVLALKLVHVLGAEQRVAPAVHLVLARTLLHLLVLGERRLEADLLRLRDEMQGVDAFDQAARLGVQQTGFGDSTASLDI